jgi:hypothetical protein
MEEHAQFDNPLMAQMAKRLEEEQARKLKEQQEIARQQQLDAFDQRIADLAAMIEKNEQLADDEFNINAILIQFLEVTLNLKKVMDMCHSIEKVLSCVSEATAFIDSSMNFSDQIFSQMNAEKYGLFARIKQRITIRRTIQNHIGRMKSIIDRVEGTMEIGRIMSSEFGKLSTKIAKSSKKKKKTQAKPGASEFPLASQYLSKRKSGEGTTGTTGGATGGSTPSWQPPATGTSGGSAPTGGIDDIL